MGRLYKRIKKFLIAGCISVCCFLLGGCSESPYQNASSQFYRIQNQSYSWDGMGEFIKNLPVIISGALKDYVVSIPMLSFIIGFLILKLIPNEPKIRKKVIITFFLVIPGIMLFLTYGTALLASIFK